MMTRARLALAAILAWCSGLAMAAIPVPPATDLQADARQAAAMGGPLLLVFVGERCGYCEVVLNDFLVPMSQNAEYANRIVMRRVLTSDTLPLRDFRGEPTTHRRFAQSIGVRMTPVVQMFSPRGLLLGKPLVGLTTVDYYGYYLDQTIDRAIELARNVTPPAQQARLLPLPVSQSQP